MKLDPAMYRRASDVIARRIAGELILVPKDRPSTDERHRSAELFVLNQTGEVLWEHMDTAASPSALAQILTAKFDVSPDRALRDVEDFLEHMLEIGGVARVQGEP